MSSRIETATCVLPAGFVGEVSAISDNRMREYNAMAAGIPPPEEPILTPNTNRFVIFPVRYHQVSKNEIAHSAGGKWRAGGARICAGKCSMTSLLSVGGTLGGKCHKRGPRTALEAPGTRPHPSSLQLMHFA